MDVTGVAVTAGALAVVVLVWVALTYTGILRLRHLVQESWRQLDVELQRRRQLLPALVDAVRGPIGHEVLEGVTAARHGTGVAPVSPAVRAQAEDALTTALDRLLAAVEDHAELRTSEPFVRLHNELAATEDRIAAGRRFYNANAHRLNARLEGLPASLVAAASGVSRAEYFGTADPFTRTTG